MIKDKKPGIGMTRLWWRRLWSDEEIQVMDDMNEYDEDYTYETEEKEEGTKTLTANETDKAG